MKDWMKVVLIMLLIGLPAFYLGPKLWPPSPMMNPTPAQLPFFMLISLVEALVFGLGIAFIFYGKSIISSAPAASKSWATSAYLGISWLLVSWWPHDNFHIHNGLDMQGLLYIEYGFHLTLIISSLAVAYYFLMLKPTAKMSRK